MKSNTSQVADDKGCQGHIRVGLQLKRVQLRFELTRARFGWVWINLGLEKYQLKNIGLFDLKG